jgi:hypothetical protein
MSFRKLKCRISVRLNKDRQITSEGSDLVNILKGTIFTFSEISNIKTSESVESITNTASFTFPKSLRFKYPNPNGESLRISPDSLFDEGDQVKLEMWYEVPIVNTFNADKAQEINSNPNYLAIFKGYISQVEVGDVITFNCDNEMYLFKKNSRLFPDDFFTNRGSKFPVKPIITASGKQGNNLGPIDHKGTTLEKLLKCYFEKVEYFDWETGTYKTYSLADAVYTQIDLPNWQTEGTLPELLDELKDFAAIYAYFRNNKLYVGPLSWPELQTTNFLFAYQQNIIDSDLKYQREENVRYRIEMYNVKHGDRQRIANGSREYFGDDDGEVRKMFVSGFDFNEKNKITENQLVELRKRAETELKKYKYTGYSGSFTTFGAAVVYHGDIVQIYDPNYTNDDRNGNYLVRQVEREYDVASAKYRQKIYVYQKVL